MSLKPGLIVSNKYEIEGHLGSGTLGDVYLAEDIPLKRKVAVKHLKSEYAKDEEALAQFEREAQTIASLRHPNIAIVHGLEQENDQSYIIMEFAEKGTLAGFLEEEGPLPIIQAIDLTIALCHALAAVHKQGILHRDIKPSNILLIELEDRIAPRLSDFGLSSASKIAPRYASPERLCENPVDTRSDIYSLGAVLYKMLTGESPFIGSLHEIIDAQRQQGPPSPRSLRKGILPALDRVVLKTLSMEREDRYQTGQEMAEDLEIARRKELEKEEQIRVLYDQANQYKRDQNWPVTIQMLEEISALDPDYKDTLQLLKEAQTQITLKTTYEQGLAALSRGDWNAAEESFGEIIHIDKTYEDAANKLEEVRQQIHLLSLYAEAGRLEEMQKWSEAIQKYTQIITMDPGYKEAAQKLLEASKRNRLQSLYDEASALFVDKNWPKAAAMFREVLHQDPEYEDAASKAKEAEKHARSQALYAAGVASLNTSEWQRAIDRFEEIRQSDPDYEEHEDVDAKLAEAERQKRWQDLFDEGVRRRGRRDWKGAIEKLTQLLSENPEHDTAARLLEEARVRQAQEKKRAKHSKDNPIKRLWASQHPAVKAALIGAAATLLVALCGFFGDTILEVVRNRQSTSAPPTPVVTSTPTPTPTPYPAPTLISPGQRESFAKGQQVKLQWKWERSLMEDEFFQVRIRLEGAQEFDSKGRTKLSYQFVSASELTHSGTYEWKVAIVSLSGEEKGVSHIWSFEVQ